MQFFAGAQAGQHDVDIAFGVILVTDTIAGRLDHLAGEVVDGDRVAHVEDIEVAARGKGARDKDKARRSGMVMK